MTEVTSAERMLSPEALEHFESQGYVKLAHAVPLEQAAAAANAIWRFLGMDHSNSDDWYRPPHSPDGMVDIHQHQALWDNRQSPANYRGFLPTVEDREALGEHRPRLHEAASQSKVSRLATSALSSLGCTAHRDANQIRRSRCLVPFGHQRGPGRVPLHSRHAPRSPGMVEETAGATRCQHPASRREQGPSDSGQCRRPYHLAPSIAPRIRHKPH